SQSNTLALARRKSEPSLPDLGVVPLRQGFDEIIYGGRLGRPDYLVPAGLGPAVPYVFLNTGVEQKRVLFDQTYMSPKVFKPDLAHINPVKPDRTALRVIESQQQIRHRGLANPAGAGNGANAARPNAET